MFRACKRVPLTEFESSRIPKRRLEMFARKDLYNMMLEKFEQDGRNIEDYLIRYTSRMVEDGTGAYKEFMIIAVTLRDAQLAIEGLQ